MEANLIHPESAETEGARDDKTGSTSLRLESDYLFTEKPSRCLGKRMERVGVVGGVESRGGGWSGESGWWVEWRVGVVGGVEWWITDHVDVLQP